VAFARIENHYFLHGGWFAPDQLIAGVDRIRHIPAAIVQGRYDVCTPAMTAWDLHRAWPEADFTMIPDAAHAASEPGIAAALRAATDRFAADAPAEDEVAAEEDAAQPDVAREAQEATESEGAEPGSAGESESAGAEPESEVEEPGSDGQEPEEATDPESEVEEHAQAEDASSR
jgi:proline iminopeptidase